MVSVVFALLPLDIPNDQQLLAAVLLGVIVLWITEPVPIPIGGLIGVGAIVVLGVVPADDALSPFGSTTVFTFIGAFILAAAMLKHGVARRFAMFILSLKWVGTSTARVIIAFGPITALLSAFVSNTATVAMLLPTALGILTVIAKLLQDKELVKPDFDPLRLRVGSALMLMLAYGASVGGLLTPVGTPPNLIGRGLIEEATGERIGFLEWMLMALPICALMFVALVARAAAAQQAGDPPDRGRRRVHRGGAGRRSAPFTRAERNTLIAFGVTVALWIFPGVVALVAGTESDLYTTVSDRLDEGIVAVLGASLLFLLPTDWKQREFTLNWSRRREDRLGHDPAVRHRDHLRLAARRHRPGRDHRQQLGGLARPDQHLRDHGLRGDPGDHHLARRPATPPRPPSWCRSSSRWRSPPGSTRSCPALAATFAASFGFMLPVSTPQNAIVYGSGVVPITKMIRSGISFDVLGALLIVVLLPPLVSPRAALTTGG